MNSRLLGCLFFLCSLFFSAQLNAQATCVAIIDSTRTEFCVGSGTVTFVNARAIGENIEWISLGDGSFDDPFAVNPTYTPGTNDRSRGFAYILLDVYKDDTIDFCSQLPWVKLNLGSMAAVATPSTQGICTGASVTSIVLSSGLSGATYRWTRDNTSTVTGIAASGTGNISGTLTNTTGAPITVTFTITASNASCTGTPVTATVVVSPRPNAVASISSQSICSGSNITPIAVSGNFPGTAFNWSRNNTTSVTGISSSGSGNITGLMTKRSGTTTTTVTFTITPNLNGCTGTAVTSTVAVSPSTVAVSGTPAAQTICSGSAITTIVPSGGTSSTSYTWARNNTSAVTGIAASGSGSISGTLNNTTSSPAYVTFTITRSSSSCTNRATVLVNPRPVAALSPSEQSICSGAAIAAINASSNIAGTVFNWTRNNTAVVTGISASGAGNITGALVNTTSSPVTVTFTITPVFNGCNGTPVTASVVVSPNPAAAVVAPLTQAVCTGSSIIPIIGNGSGIVFNWIRNNTATVTGIPASGTGNIEGILNSAGVAAEQVTFTITPSANGCVGVPVNATVTVNPRPTAMISGSQAVCTGSAAPELSIAFTGTAPWNVTYTNGTTTVPVNTNNNPYSFTVPAAAGTYTLVSVGDANCTALPAAMSGSAVITQPAYTISASTGVNGFITPAGVTNVNCGNDQTYFISANTGFVISDVLVDGVSIGAVSSYTFSQVNAAHVITAVFKANTFTINASAGNNGSISPAGETTVSAGSNHTYAVSAAGCYQIADVLVDAVSVGAVSSYTFTDITASHTISASFTPTEFVITASAGENGVISNAGINNIACGTSPTFTFTANSCYQIADVLVDGISVGVVASYTFENVTAPHSINVRFSQLNYSITATTGANGTISSAGVTNIDCGATKTYSITADEGYTIADVLVDGLSAGAVSSYTFNSVTANHSIQAIFGAGLHPITASAGANGVITPAGVVSVDNGASATYTIAANSCYQITDVLVDGISVGAVSSYTFNNITAAHTISASFTQLSYAITANAGANGSITAAGVTNVNCGGIQTYTITADAGFTIQSVIVDGVSAGAVSTYTFNNVTAPHTINAVFAAVSNCALRASATVAAMACNATTTNITVTTSGATGVRQFSLNGGAYQSSNIFAVTAAGSPYVVTVRDATTGCLANTNIITVSPAPTSIPATPTGVDGTATGLCSGGNFTYTVQPVAGATSYVWSAPAGFSIVTGQGTPQIVMTVPAGFTGTPGLWAVSKNSCGSTTGFRLALSSLQTIAAANITGPSSVTASQAGVQYSVPNEPGATYNWQVPAGAAITAGQGSSSITVTFGSTSGNVSVAVTNACGTGARTNKAVAVVPGTNTFAITASAGANGVITPAGVISVDNGASPTYTIAANSCYQIADVLVDGLSVGAVSSYTFSNVNAAHTINASFAQLSYAVTASAGANGTISNAGVNNIACGTSPSFTITANSCYQIADVIVDGISVGAVSSYTFNNITAAHTISASFTQLSYAITASAGANGSITAAGVTNVNCGGIQTYTITADAGFTIQSVMVDGVSAGAVSTYTFNNVTAPHTINAVFAAVSNCALRASATVAAMACNATTTNITVTTSGATGVRQFSLNGGAYQSSNIFAVTAAGSPYVVTVRDATTGCLASTNIITVSPAPTSIPATPTGVDGTATGLCSGGNFTYTVQPVAGATSYVWSAPAGFSIVTGQGTPQIVMTVPAGFTGTPGLWAVSKNSCGSTTGFRLALSSLQTIAAANITGPSSVTASQAGVQYSVPNEPGATYNWQVPAGAAITAGQGSSSITVTFGSTSGNVSVAVTNACGTGARTNKAVSFVLTRPAMAKTAEITVNNTLKNALSMYPNPAYNSAAMVFNSERAGEKYSIHISNSTGYTVYTSANVTAAGQNRLQLDLSEFKNGIYFVRLTTANDIQTIRLIKGQ